MIKNKYYEYGYNPYIHIFIMQTQSFNISQMYRRGITFHKNFDGTTDKLNTWCNNLI